MSREVFDKANLTAIKHDNVTKAKDGHQANPKHTYVLRSFLRCGLCGLQTHGNVKKRPQRRLLHVRDQPPAPRSWSDICSSVSSGQWRFSCLSSLAVYQTRPCNSALTRTSTLASKRASIA